MATIAPITRDQLAKFLPDNDTIRRFEQLFLLAGNTTPENIDIIFRLIDEVLIGTGSAIASADMANALLDRIAQSVEVLSSAPVAQPFTPEDNLAPPMQIGTMGEQQADRVRITGGTIDGATIGATAASPVTGTTLASTTTTTVGTLLDISAAAAGQIKFPATANPSADANTLDDYEEGTWTPSVTFTTPGDLAVVYAARSAAYTKIGRQVFLNFLIATSSFTHTTASGSLLITGLPFASGVPNQIAGCLDWQGITKVGYTQIAPVIVGAASTITMIASGSGLGRATVTTVDSPSGSVLFLSGTLSYFI